MKLIKLEHIDKANIFKVPYQYFDNLPQEILNEIENLEINNLKNIDAKTIFETPKNYFEDLTLDILNKTTVKPLLSLGDLDKISVFEAPQSYFEDLPLQIQQKTYNQKKVFFTKKNIFYGLSLVSIVTVLLLIFIFNWNSNQDFDFKLNKNILSSVVKDKKTDKLKVSNKDKKTKDIKLNKDKSIVKTTEVQKNTIQNNKVRQVDTSSKIEISSEQTLLAYLEQTALDEEDLVEVLIEEQAAGAEDILLDLALGYENDYQEITEEDFEKIEEILQD